MTFTIPARVLPGAASGSHKLKAQVRYQACSRELCLPPKLVKLEAPIEIVI